MISAPLSGRMAQVLVEVGEVIQANQVVTIIESIKMQNGIGSPRDGVIEALHVGVGDQVGVGGGYL